MPKSSDHQTPDSLQEKAVAARRWFRRMLLGLAFIYGLILIWALFPSIRETIRQSPVLSGTLLFAVYLAALLGKICLTRWAALGAPVHNYKRSRENKAELEKLIATYRPYGIYLRDFGPESISIASPFAGGMGEIATDMLALSTITEDPVENSLVKQVSRHLPFYALLNVDDINDRPIANRIYCEDFNWFDYFVRYAGSAALFIVNIDRITSAITQELDWIMQPTRIGRTLLVAPESIVKQVRQKYPKFDDRHWVVERPERKGEYGTEYRSVKAPEPVLKFVRSLASKYAVVPQPLSVVTRRFLKAIGKTPESSPTSPLFVMDRGQTKSKSKVIYTGQVRNVEELKIFLLEIWMKNRGLPPKATELFEHEMLFREGESEYWLPIRNEVFDKMAARWKEGDTVIIKTLLTGVMFRGSCTEWLFIVDEYSE
jgi:hypothetical protein